MEIFFLYELGFELFIEFIYTLFYLLLRLLLLPFLGQHHRIVAHQCDLQKSVGELIRYLNLSHFFDCLRKLFFLAAAVIHIELFYHPTVCRKHTVVGVLSSLDVPK